MVSIICSTYNHEEFIKNCIESVLEQTYSDWELIIIDDFSNDKTPKICQVYKNMDKRIKYIRHKKRWGIENLVNTYNQALKLSNGELIAVLEGDDFWPSDKLEKQIVAFQNKSLVLSYGNAVITKPDGFPIDLVCYKDDEKNLNNNPPPVILKKFIDINFYLEAVTVIIRKEILLKIGGFQKNFHYPFIDYPTWLRLSLEGTFSYQNEVLGYYRRHINSSWFDRAVQSNAMLRRESVECYWNMVEKYENQLRRLNFTISRKDFQKTQEKMLTYKMKKKKVSVFFHYALFGGEKMLNKAGKKIINDTRNSIYIRLQIFIALVLLLYARRIIDMFLYFRLRFLLLKIKISSV